MIYAYDEMYLKDAQYNLGNMLDFAVYGAGQSLNVFYDLFINSKIARSFAHGSPKYIAGRSGVELVLDLFYELYGDDKGLLQAARNYNDKAISGRSPEFWTGYALAYYQWLSGLSFSHINEIAPIESVLRMYPKYHEMDIQHFVDRMETLRNDKSRISRLKAYRLRLNLSQSELAKRTSIPLKTLQNYEQRLKDINKANVSYMIRLSRALYCNVEDLLE